MSFLFLSTLLFSFLLFTCPAHSPLFRYFLIYPVVHRLDLLLANTLGIPRRLCPHSLVPSRAGAQVDLEREMLFLEEETAYSVEPLFQSSSMLSLLGSHGKIDVCLIDRCFCPVLCRAMHGVCMSVQVSLWVTLVLDLI